jgi:endonuclease III
MVFQSSRSITEEGALQIVERFNGQVPRTFEELESLPGVGHKTASVIMSQCFGHAAFAVDTHVHRLALRWGEEERVVRMHARLPYLRQSRL